MNNYILAVDDIPDNLFLIQLALEQEGYEVAMVNNGEKALEKIEQDPPKLVLLDVMMPGMDGYEVTRRIRQHPSLPFIPILLITAHEEPSLIKGLDLGADEFIRKPIQIDELQARVRSLLRLKEIMDQRDNFVSCLTHDLRTPIVAAERMLELIKQGVFGNTPPPMESVITAMISNHQNLLNMLNVLLDVHRYENGQKVLSFISVSLSELVEEVVEQLRPLAQEKGLRITMNLPENPIEIPGDRLELQRVLTNLVSNAIKFTDSGEVSIRLRFENEELPQAILEVEDTGIGMTPETKNVIFERFRQGNHKRSGHGLGLHLCYQIIEAHQGTIEVCSEPGKGSLFSIRLPIQ